MAIKRERFRIYAWAVLGYAEELEFFDTIDGAFMTAAYRWSFAQPVREVAMDRRVLGVEERVEVHHPCNARAPWLPSGCPRRRGSRECRRSG